MLFNRIIYFGYYLKELDRKKFEKFLTYVSKETGQSRLRIIAQVISASLQYNISLLEYFQFRFYEINEAEKQQFAGTGYMYEYQLKMNPKQSRKVLSDKILFLDKYGTFVKHKFATIHDVRSGADNIKSLLNNNSGKIVMKSSDGQCGNGIEVVPLQELDQEKLIRELERTGNDYVEEFVVQHPDLMRLSPSGLNTVRIITQLDTRDNVHILGARLRITVNSAVDNMAAGNMAAVIDPATGVVIGPGVYSDITKDDALMHPITGTSIIGFQVPYWKETMHMIQAAAVLDKHNRSIGWDVAITENGPELIEGNHDWCKLLWQLPAKKGLKQELEKFL